MEPAIETDFLVIGSGIAGLWFARRVAGIGRVVIITKKSETESNTNYAQGGIAAAVAQDDSPELHYKDTIAASAGIAHPDIVRLVTEAGPKLVRELDDLGVSFSTAVDSAGRVSFDLGREGGHCRRRIVHARDLTGSEIERGLLRVVRAADTVRIVEQSYALELAVADDGSCSGAFVLLPGEEAPQLVRARFTLLATGGCGQVYQHTTNPPIATGDGIAMGYRAGARVSNMEFVQFHPTSLFGRRVEGRAFLISEAVRGEGAYLVTRAGRRFMPEHHPDAELAPRDVVARAIAAELRRSGDDYVLLDARAIGRERLMERFPHIYQTCLQLGIDITAEPIPVVPAAHYICGGLQTNEWAETSVPALFAAGECACSGLHGANRLASNSLLEALVFADRAAERVRMAAARRGELGAGTLSQLVSPQSNEHMTGQALAEIRALMWREAGIIRTDAGLARARKRLSELAAVIGGLATAGPGRFELVNLLTVARLIVECAQRRPESRGLHFNLDHPAADAAYERDTVVSRAELEAAR